MKNLSVKPRMVFSISIVIGIALLMTAAAELLVYIAFMSPYSNVHLGEYIVGLINNIIR